MKNKIVDSHCHLDFDDYSNDLDTVIRNAKLNDVEYLLSISVNLEKFKTIHNITKKYKNIWFIAAHRLFFIHMSNPPEIELYRCKKRRILRHNIFINISTLVSLFTRVKDFNIW